MEEDQNKEIIAQYMEHDAAVLQENGVYPKEAGQTGSIKSRYWKFMGGFFVLLLVALVAVPFVGDYMEKQEDQMRSEQIAAGDQVMRDLRERLANDKDGGATAEETLQLFTAALQKGDIEQAEKYFVIEPQERQQMLIGRLEQIRKEGRFETLLEYLGKAKAEKDSSDSDGYTGFSYLENGKVQLGIEITKNNYSTVWKIENLMY